ncbi:MAG: ABC transporter ATP-binding protein [Lachnospiraceae bacterium]
MIQVKNLVKKYGDHLAVNNISFTIEQGKIYGFLGPNGAGKSTTLNMITGYIGATEGEILIKGHDILKDAKKAKSCIGYLPEQPPLYIDMTVNEYLMFVAHLKGIVRFERKINVDEVCELIRIEDVRYRLIKNLSKGYRQRVGLAAAVLGFPEIIILDEPMVGLDPKQITEIRDLIRTLSEEHTIILSSHILAEIQEMCDHVIIISKGNIVASDTPANLEEMALVAQKIEVDVNMPAADVDKILDPIESITSYRTFEKDGITKIDITSTGDQAAVCEELSKVFVENGTPVRKLYPIKPSLEDVFLELTQIPEQEEVIEGTVVETEVVVEEEESAIPPLVINTEEEETKDVSDL